MARYNCCEEVSTMAKVKYGGGVADMRNAFAGQVHSRNTYGNYIRQKVSPVQPRTPRQTEVRHNLAQLSRRYSTQLTDAQRNAWIAFAAANPVVDVFGNSIALTGINFYQRVNNLRLLMGLPVLDDPPRDFAVQELTSASLTVVGGTTPAMNVAFAPSPPPAGHRVEVWLTEPVAPGVMFFGSKLRLIAISPANQASPFDVTQAYLARFGTVPIGRKIGGWIRLVNEANGAQSKGIIVSAIATAPQQRA